MPLSRTRLFPQAVHLLLTAAAAVPGILFVQASDRCRIHTDSAAKWSPYPWRNAYTPASPAMAAAGSDSSPAFVTHQYGYCEGGKGPWAWGSNNATVAECMAQAVKLKATCFDYMCVYHDAANCTCPDLPPITPSPAATAVACVGDSITAGVSAVTITHTASNPSVVSGMNIDCWHAMLCAVQLQYLSSCGLDYPHQLQRMLGTGYEVTNYGVGGQTMFKPSHQVGRESSYWNRVQYQMVLNSSADVIVLMLGTNDAKADRWQTYGKFFADDYSDMVASFQQMKSKPRVFLMVPPPLYVNGCYQMNATVTNSFFPGNGPVGIRTIAAKMSLPSANVIDIYSLFQEHCPVASGTPGHRPTCEAPHVNATCGTKCDWIGSGGLDGCHPDDIGYSKLAKAVLSAITPEYI